jgi:hypothetical protein
MLIDDILSCLEGVDGDYIVPDPLQGPYEARTFSISESVGKFRMNDKIIVIIFSKDVRFKVLTVVIMMSILGILHCIVRRKFTTVSEKCSSPVFRIER